MFLFVQIIQFRNTLTQKNRYEAWPKQRDLHKLFREMNRWFRIKCMGFHFMKRMRNAKESVKKWGRRRPVRWMVLFTTNLSFISFSSKTSSCVSHFNVRWSQVIRRNTKVIIKYPFLANDTHTHTCLFRICIHAHFCLSIDLLSPPSFLRRCRWDASLL